MSRVSEKSFNGKTYYVWEKGTREGLSKHFSTHEMSCHCQFASCKEQRISKALIQRLEKLRDDFQMSLLITSAYRCNYYQAFLRGTPGMQTAKGTSTHELGDAVDAAPSNPTKGTMKRLFELSERYFKAIGTAKRFLHLDLRDDKVRRWLY